MKKSKHTKLPWKVYYAKNNGQIVLGIGEEDGQAITNHSGAFWREDDEAKANSEFVVHACNNHYEMLEALEAADELIGKLALGINTESFEVGAYIKNALCSYQDQVQTAIRKAKGEK